MGFISPEHKLLKIIKSQSSRNKKLEILEYYKRSTKLRNIFLYSLDPFRKYFISRFPNNGIADGKGTGIINSHTWNLLNDIASRKITGAEAKNKLFNHMQSLYPSEAVLLKKIVLHNLGIGVAEGIVNSVWKGLIAERFIQRAEDYDTRMLVFPSIVGLKLDGIRADYKGGFFTSRSGHTISGLDHIAEDIESKGGGEWDGELIVPKLDFDFDSTSGYLRSKSNSKPEARYVIFDNLTVHSLKQSIRLRTVYNTFPNYDPAKKEKNPSVTGLRHYICNSEDEIMYYFSSVLQKGFEGLMIKHPRARYRAGKTYNWMKLKKGYSKEFVIIDYYEGEDDFSGTLGGVVIQISDNITCRVGSGFSKDKRDEYWNNPKKILGRLATINFMDYTSNGSLRHPVFKNIRWDI